MTGRSLKINFFKIFHVFRAMRFFYAGKWGLRAFRKPTYRWIAAQRSYIYRSKRVRLM